jgi:hypothetical protein
VSDAVFRFVWTNFDHVLAALLLISRLGDIGTTYLITPTLRLEANPVVRKLGWPYAIVTLLICLLPYYNEALAVMILVPFLLVSAGNAGRIWFARTIGEEEYQAILIRAARRSRPIQAILPICLSTSFMILTGLVVLFFYPDAASDWGFYLGAGIVMYGVIVGLFGMLAMRRLFRLAAAAPDASA